MNCPRAVIFDLDNTLSESFQAPKKDVANALHKLMELMPVAIMTGASFERMNENFLPSFPTVDRSRLYLFPDTAAQCFVWKENKWQSIYKHAFSQEDYEKILRIFNEAIKKTKVLEGAPRWGDLFLARDVQITFAGLGVDASAEEKAKWDPDRGKRKKLKDYLDRKLPGFDIRISGRTAIDITAKSVDKAHGVRWFSEKLGIKPGEMIFVGDDLGPGGNDAVVIPSGIKTIEVAGPHETAGVIEEILEACKRS